jgi:hypothetical protein
MNEMSYCLSRDLMISKAAGVEMDVGDMQHPIVDGSGAAGSALAVSYRRETFVTSLASSCS